MGFFDHLEEFRKRLIVCLIAVFVAFLLCWAWAQEIFDLGRMNDQSTRPVATALYGIPVIACSLSPAWTRMIPPCCLTAGRLRVPSLPVPDRTMQTAWWF
jgi:Sec-independent protein secretion pathway component TatC